MSVQVLKHYVTPDGRLSAVKASAQGVEFDVRLDTGVVGWSSDWSVGDGTPFTWGRNYGPGAYGHTDVVVKPDVLAALKAAR